MYQEQELSQDLNSVVKTYIFYTNDSWILMNNRYVLNLCGVYFDTWLWEILNTRFQTVVHKDIKLLILAFPPLNNDRCQFCLQPVSRVVLF